MKGKGLFILYTSPRGGVSREPTVRRLLASIHGCISSKRFGPAGDLPICLLSTLFTPTSRRGSKSGNDGTVRLLLGG